MSSLHRHDSHWDLLLIVIGIVFFIALIYPFGEGQNWLTGMAPSTFENETYGAGLNETFNETQESDETAEINETVEINETIEEAIVNETIEDNATELINESIDETEHIQEPDVNETIEVNETIIDDTSVNEPVWENETIEINETLENDTIEINETIEINQTINETNQTNETKEKKIVEETYGAMAAPTMDEVKINSSYLLNGTNENLTAYAINVADGDGDNVTLAYDWRLDGNSIAVLNVPFDREYSCGENCLKSYSSTGLSLASPSSHVISGAGRNGSGAAYFNGINSRMIDISANNEVLSPDNISIAIWIKFNDFDQDPYTWPPFLVAKRHDSEGTGYFIAMNWGSDNSARLPYFWVSGNIVYAKNNFTVDKWYHIVATYDGNNISMYINGTLEDTAAATRNSTLSTGMFTIGCTYSYGGGAWVAPLDGYIDELKLFNRSLTADQIAALYNDRPDLIVSSETITGEKWSACITPLDNSSDGTQQCSENLTILDITSPPDYSTCYTNATSATSDGILQVTAVEKINHSINCKTVNISSTLIVDNAEAGNVSINITAQNIILNSNGIIDTTGKGYQGGAAGANGNGPGAGQYEYGNGGGAGHGGDGGKGENNNNEGSAYGAILRPSLVGSGGGGAGWSGLGGHGAGSIFFNATSSFILDGKIYANGTAGTNPSGGGGGGGSGGSIWIIAESLTGSGSIYADGGDAGCYSGATSEDGGGGAGGRIAVYDESGQFAGTISAAGGEECTGSEPGDEGTIFICSGTLGADCYPEGNTTLFTSYGTINLTTAYSNETSAAIQRKIKNAWTQNYTKWNDTSSDATTIAFYNISGLRVSTNYDVFDNSALAYTKATDASGDLSFNRTLSSEHEIKLVASDYNKPPVIESLSLNTTSIFNYTTANLTAHATASDENLDNISLIYDWRMNGTSIAVLNMPFDSNNSGGSGKTKDYSTFSNNGTVNGAVWNATGGWNGSGAYMFDGSSSYVDVGTDSSLDFTSNNFTIAMWFYANDFNTVYPVLAHKGDWNSDGYYFQILNDGNPGSVNTFQFATNQVGAYQRTKAADSVLSTGVWTHVVASRNGSTVRLFKDGVEVSYQLQESHIDPVSSPDEFLIGKYRPGDQYHFNGIIDNVLLFNRSLSAEQVKALYENRTDLIVSQETDVGDNWNVCVTPNDGLVDGDQSCAGNLTVTAVVNHAPTIESVSITASSNTNTTDENLTATLTGVSDTDGDDVSKIFDWRVNGTSIAVLNMNFDVNDSGGSGVTKDYSMFSNNGTVTDAVWNTSSGWNNTGAFEFDGVGDYLDLGTSLAGQLGDSVTDVSLSLWFKTDITSDDDGIFYIGSFSDANGEFEVMIYSDELYFMMDAGGFLNKTSFIDTGSWHHVVAVYDGSYGKLYLDNSEVFSEAYSASLDFSGLKTIIGGYYSSTYTFDGKIDEVKFFNKSLSAEQIKALYENRTDLLVSQETTSGDNISVCVTPNDGIEDGATSCSGSMTILAEAPLGCVDLNNGTDIEEYPGIINTSASAFFIWENVTVCQNAYSFDVGNGAYFFTINGSNIVVDFGGSNFTNSNINKYGYGIYLRYNNGADNVTLKDGTFKEFQYGMYAVGDVGNLLTGVEVRDCTFESSGYDGIWWQPYVQNSVLNGVVSRDNDRYGVYLRGPDLDYNLIVNSSFLNNGDGINEYGVYLYDADWNNVTGCNFTGNYYAGLYLQSAAEYNLVWDNYFANGVNVYSGSGTSWFNSSYDCSRPNIMGGNCTGGNFYNDSVGFVDDGRGRGVYANASDGVADDMGYRIFTSVADSAVDGTDYLPLTLKQSGCTVARDRPNYVVGDPVLCTDNYSVQVDTANDWGAVMFDPGAVGLDCNGSVFTGTSTFTGLYFDGDSDHVVVRNCTFKDYDYGMYVVGTSENHVDNISVYDSTFESNDFDGILWQPYVQSSVLNGVVSRDNDRYGVYLRGPDLDYNLIVNSSFLNNGDGINEYGVYLYDADWNNVTGCNFTGNYYAGLYLQSAAEYNLVWDNYFANGVNVYSGSGTSWFNSSYDCSRPNIMGGNCTGGNFYNDSVGFVDDGRGRGVYANASDGVADDMGYRIFTSVADSAVDGTDYLPLTLKQSGCTVARDRPNYVVGDPVLCTDNYSVQVDTANDWGAVMFDPGAVGLDCNGSVFTGTSTYTGLYFDGDNDHVVVRNCTFKDYDYGMYVVGTSENHVDNISVYDSTFESNDYEGIWWYNYVYNSLLHNIVAKDNTRSGFWLDENHMYNIINDSDAINNGAGADDYGIALDNSDYNNITNCNISGNDKTGIYFYNDADNNWAYNNYLDNAVNANDANIADANANRWNISKTLGINIIGGPYIGGNLWADNDTAAEGCIDVDGDGICDGDYVMTGTGIDYLPLSSEYENEAPEITSLVLNSSLGTNTTDENLTAYVSVSDADGDDVSKIIDWRLNGSSIAVLNMNFDVNNSAGAGETRDYSTFSNNGTVNGAVWNATGGWNSTGAYNLGGIGNISVGDVSSLDFGTGEFTVAYWMYIDSGLLSANTEYGVVNKNNMFEGAAGWGMEVSTWLYSPPFSNVNLYGFNTGQAVWCNTCTSAVVTTSAWHHVVMTRNSSALALYVDGILEQNNTHSDVGISVDNSEPVVIGNHMWGPNLPATIDDLKIFNRSLSAEQILALYNNRTDLVVSQETEIGDNWSVCVTANDGFVDGDTNCSSGLNILEVPNSAPVIDSLVLNSTAGANTTDENLTAYVSVSDADGDDVSKIIDWRLNGSSIAVLNMNFDVNNSAGAGKTRDYSTFSNNGTVNGAVWNATGGWNQTGAFVFDGTNDYLEVVDDDSLDFPVGASFTISGWIKRAQDVSTGEMWVLTKGSDVGRYWFGMADVGSFGTLYVNTYYGPGQDHWLLATTEFKDTEWHNLAWVIDKTAGMHYLYYDGILAQNYSVTNGANVVADALQIGRLDSPSSKFWNGSIDDLIIYDRALSQEQVIALYNNRSDLLVSQETSLGDNWSVCVTPNDGVVDGDTNCTSGLEIVSAAAPANNPPVIDSLVLNSTDGTNLTAENLTAYVTTSDVDGDNVSKIIDWRLNGSSIAVLNMNFDVNNSAGAGETRDYSTFSNNCTVSGAVWNASAGWNGSGAFVFDGVDDVINAGNVDLVHDTMTVAAWVYVKSTDPGYTKGIVSKKDDSVAGDGLVLGHYNSMWVFSVNGWSSSITNSTSFALNTWKHVVGTYDGSHSSLYVDGELVAGPTAGSYNVSNDDNLLIGRHVWDSDVKRWFNGTIDDVKIFNRSLSAEQIKALYENRTDLIVSQETNVGDNWSVCVTPNDGVEDGNMNCSDGLIIEEVPTSIAVSLSNALDSGINWSVTSLPAINLSANNNNGTNITEYDVEIIATGTTVDVYIKAGSNLTTGSGDYIGLGNETFSYNSTNSTVPDIVKYSLTTNYSDNKIGSGLANGTKIYLKFFLNVPGSQAAGTYRNNVSINAVQAGQSPD